MLNFEPADFKEELIIPLIRRISFAKVLCLLLLLWPHGSEAARADPAQPYPAIRYEHRVTENPAQDVYVMRVDLTNSDVDVRVAQGGPDPDGTGEYQTTLQTPTTIAEREHFEVVINGDFFAARSTADAEGAKSGYVTGKWGKVVGPAVTDGYLWGPAPRPRAALLMDAHKQVHIDSVKEVPDEIMQAVAGSDIILRDGKSRVEDSSFARTRHPRTAVGIADAGKTLVLVVVDGRHAGVATGMRLAELADLMQQLGCRDALNLDGGGSSEMALRDPQSGQLQVLNHPSDGRERAVANVLGITIRGSRRVPLTLAVPAASVSPAAPASPAPPSAPEGK